MNPVVILAIETMLKYGPDAARAARELLKKSEPTDEDFNRLFQLADKTYDTYREEARKRAGL
jgi:hypothetical protein